MENETRGQSLEGGSSFRFYPSLHKLLIRSVLRTRTYTKERDTRSANELPLAMETVLLANGKAEEKANWDAQFTLVRAQVQAVSGAQPVVRRGRNYGDAGPIGPADTMVLSSYGPWQREGPRPEVRSSWDEHEVTVKRRCSAAGKAARPPKVLIRNMEGAPVEDRNILGWG
jgi:hypothetical protein